MTMAIRTTLLACLVLALVLLGLTDLGAYADTGLPILVVW